MFAHHERGLRVQKHYGQAAYRKNWLHDNACPICYAPICDRAIHCKVCAGRITGYMHHRQIDKAAATELARQRWEAGA